MQPKLNAVIYARYSSNNQREESIDAQVRACEEYAASHEITIVDIYADEAISGKGLKTKKRAQYQRMLRDINKGNFTTILVHKYDRIARNVQEHVNLAMRLNAENIELIAVSQDFGTSKEAKIMKVLTWAMSEYYIDNLASESRKGHRETALKGLHNGGYPPFGYDVIDQKYVINEVEAMYVRKMYTACLNGENYKEILEDLRAAGITGKRGKPMSYSSIYEILRNEKYTGVYIYTPEQNRSRESQRIKKDAIRLDGAIPQIIDREIWEGVQKIMSSRKNTGKTTKNEYLYSGLIFCKCGAPMHASTSRRTKNGHTYEYKRYICSKKCGAKSISSDKIDVAVFQYLYDLLSPENREILKNGLNIYKSQITTEFQADKAEIRRQIADRNAQIDAATKNLSSAVLPTSVVESLGKKIEELQNQISDLEYELSRPIEFSEQEVYNYFDVVADLAHQPFEVRKSVVRHFIKRIDIKENSLNVESTFREFVRKYGCGGAIPLIPTIFFGTTIPL